MAVSLPNELQQAICQLLLNDPNYTVKIMRQLIGVNKQWAHFVCNAMYRHYRINKYVPFIGFYNTIVSKRQILPYGEFIRSLDMTAINKYGVDMRAHELIQRCPNLQSVTLGHPTSLKPATIQWLARNCKRLRTLSVGALESFPFMLECDFSSLDGLETMVFSTTPLLSSSLLTLPRTLKELHLVRMDTLDTDTMITFFQHHHERQRNESNHECITRLAIHRCPRLLNGMTKWLPLNQLKWLSLSGPDICDDHVIDVLTQRGSLDTLVLDNTQITTKTLDFLNSFTTGNSRTSAAGQCSLKIKHLHLTKNINVAMDKQGLTMVH
ncbi:hypothetical protein BCR42DRAFT_405705 [Absidia repens]|uniref:F-box domain-containing protein n=1 Tax=Absidia repens TaxID=90262 RepID=A0A1X2ITT3_9FUNG|nr:hypothetical protein BCR42DRAFT_405705 [Absidia repens]